MNQPPEPAPPMATSPEEVKRIADGYIEATKQVTDVVKYIGAGLIALFFAAVTSSGTLADVATANPFLTSSIAFLGVGCLLLDYLNHLMRRCAYSNILKAIDQGKKLYRSPDGRHLLFDPDDPHYDWARRFFKAKQWFAAIGCAAVILLFAKHALATLFPAKFGF